MSDLLVEISHVTFHVMLHVTLRAAIPQTYSTSRRSLRLGKEKGNNIVHRLHINDMRIFYSVGIK